MAHLEKTIPTLLLFECVLAYMSPDASSAVISWFTDYFTESAHLGGLVYEMFGLEDAFGKVMQNNLKVSHFYRHFDYSETSPIR